MERTRKEESRRIVAIQSMQPAMQQTMEMRPYSAPSIGQEKRVVESHESLSESAHTTPRVDKD